jgi:hypothetical protein
MRVLRLAGAVVGALALIGFGSLLGAAAAAKSPATLDLPPNGIVQVGCKGTAIASGEPQTDPGANLGCEPSRAKPFQIYKASGRTSASATVDTEGFNVTGAIFLAAAQPAGSRPQTIEITDSSDPGKPSNIATFIQRVNTEAGDVELWDFAADIIDVTFTAIASDAGSEVQMTVLTFLAGRECPCIPTPVGASSGSGAPTTTVTPQFTDSTIYAVGVDDSRAVNRKIPKGQGIYEETLGTDCTLWLQYVKAPTEVGVPVTLNDLGPKTDPWDFLAVEISPASA